MNNMKISIIMPSLERPDLLLSYVQKGVNGCRDKRDSHDPYEPSFRKNISVLGKHVQELSSLAGIPLKIRNKKVMVPDKVFVNPLRFSNIKEIIDAAKKRVEAEKVVK